MVSRRYLSHHTQTNPFLSSPNPSMNNTTVLSTAFSLSLVLLPLLACSCPFEIFSCQGRYSNTNVTQCNAHNIQCRNSTLWVRFFRRGHWYEARNITFPEKTFKLLDPLLASKLQQNRECDFLYNFAIPIHGFYPPTYYRFLDHTYTLFNCTMSSYDFTRDIFQKCYDLSHCQSYELFYTHRPLDRSDDNGNCTSTGGEASVEWKLSYTEGKGGDLEFSLLSLAFTHGRAASPECFGCVMREGWCSAAAAAASSSECSCNLECHIGHKLNMTGKILIALGSLAAGFLLALLAFYLWRGQRQTRSVSRDLLFQSGSADFSADKDPEALVHSSFHTPIFPYEELEVATGGFDSSRELGDGGFSIVYKGKMLRRK